MKKFGLALSGGGFRATLFHLGLIRFLRDAGLMPRVSHITSVSGGSICAAHLVLNWNRYTGSTEEFDSAAAELINFVRLGVRNRIVRRFPLLLPLRGLRRLIGMSNRQMTRTGLLEYLYEQHLYGDASMFELPEHPRLHILATNLSEGVLCSFNRDGLWMIRRGGEHGHRIDRVSAGLATVAMAVAASSAFPGFFPPLQVTGAEVGARSGEFGRHAYTDGAVFDNLGVRMFHYLAEDCRTGERPWDGVLVSDVGKPFEIQSNMRAGGLIRTAMRASDILMDRVWQLENETLQDTTGFAFARITDIIDPESDPTALHLELQRQLSRVRTDLDRFSELEIRTLVQHGYCVGRNACRSLPDVFGTDLPSTPPWIPSCEAKPTATPTAIPKDPQDRLGHSLAPSDVTRDARALHASAVRRIWSTLLDYRDWTSYVYVPIIVPILVLAPYFAVKSYERSQRINQIIESLAQASRDVEQMSLLLEGPVTPFVGEKAEELAPDAKFDPKGFLILQDLRMIDLRNWDMNAGGRKAEQSFVYGYRRLKVLKEDDNENNHDFRASVLALSPETQVRFPRQQLQPKLYSRPQPGSLRGDRHWVIGADFRKVPSGDSVDIVYEHISPGLFLRDGMGSTTLSFDVEVETVELTRWLLLPKGKEYHSYRLIRHPTAKPELAENVKVVTQYVAEDNSILAFKLLALNAGFTYEITWFYR